MTNTKLSPLELLLVRRDTRASLCVLGLVLDEGGGKSIPPSRCSVWHRCVRERCSPSPALCPFFLFPCLVSPCKWYHFSEILVFSFCPYLCNLLFPLCLNDSDRFSETPTTSTSLSHSMELPRCLSLRLTLSPCLYLLDFSTPTHSDSLFSLSFLFTTLLFPILILEFITSPASPFFLFISAAAFLP